MGKAIAIEGCTILANMGAIQSPTGSFTVKTKADTNVSLSAGACYFGDIEVVVPSGSALASGATLVDPVTITIKATGDNATTDKGKALLEGDHSSGEDQGTFQQGQATSKVKITLTVTEAGQSDVLLD